MTDDAKPSSLVSRPPGGILRFLFRLPIYLYRWHLGWLLGGRALMIDHVGRKSGKLHQAVVEVVEHDRSDDSYFVASGWGYKANWYQNLTAHPETTIHVGRRTLAVRAETLPPPQAAQRLINYREHHRFLARELGGMMGIDIATSSPEELEKLVSAVAADCRLPSSRCLSVAIRRGVT